MRRSVFLIVLLILLLLLKVSWPWIIAILAILALILFFVLDYVVATVEKKSNRVLQKPPYRVSEDALKLQQKNFMVD